VTVSFPRRTLLHVVSYAIFEVFTEVKIQIEVLWVVTLCSIVKDTNISEDHVPSILHPVDGSSMVLRKVGIPP
jgi:hypothetical protein